MKSHLRDITCRTRTSFFLPDKKAGAFWKIPPHREDYVAQVVAAHQPRRATRSLLAESASPNVATIGGRTPGMAAIADWSSFTIRCFLSGARSLSLYTKSALLSSSFGSCEPVQCCFWITGDFCAGDCGL